MIELSEIAYRSGFKQQLDDEFWVRIPWLAGRFEETVEVDRFMRVQPDGTLRLLPGYAWDGASGPTWDTRSFIRGPAAHDGLYQLFRAGILNPEEDRSKADDLMLEIILQDIDVIWSGARWAWLRPLARARARVWHDGVDWFASSAADPKSRKKIYRVP